MATESYNVVPVTAPKVAVVQRSTISRETREETTSRTTYSVPNVEGITSQDLSQVLNSVTNLEHDRMKEKDQLRRTNNRLAGFLEKMHFFDAANKLAATKLKAVQENIGKEPERIKALYEAEIANVKNLLEDVDRQREDVDKKVKNLDAEVNNLRGTHDDEAKKANAVNDQLEKQNRELVDAEGNWTMLRRKVEQAQDDRNKLKKENQQLRQAVNLARRDLHTLNLDRVQAESRAHSLEEDIEFLKMKWDNEKRELEKLAFQDPGTQSREFWKSEVQQMLKELYDDFDTELANVKDEMAAAHSVKQQELLNERARDNVEVVRLKKDLTRLQSSKNELMTKVDNMEPRADQFKKKMDDLKNEYEPKLKQVQDDLDKIKEQRGTADDHVKKLFDEVQKLLQANVKLEAEIARYRALLDQGEAGLKKDDKKEDKKEDKKDDKPAPTPAPAPKKGEQTSV